MKRGFTLIELSMVLIIVGIIIAASFTLFKSRIENAKTQKAKDIVAAAKDAVIGNTIINNNTLPPSSFFQQNLSPVKLDNHPLFYAYDSRFTSNNICIFNSTNLQIITPTKTVSNIAFVIAHEGANANMQTAVKNIGGIDTVKTYRYETKVDDNTTPVNNADYYDDIVEWVTLSELKEKLKCNQKALRFLNDTLPTAKVGNSYNATLYIENNFTSVSISCSTLNGYGISFNSSTNTFGGIPTAPGVAKFDCTASEAPPSSRSISRSFVITINP